MQRAPRRANANLPLSFFRRKLSCALCCFMLSVSGGDAAQGEHRVVAVHEDLSKVPPKMQRKRERERERQRQRASNLSFHSSECESLRVPGSASVLRAALSLSLSEHVQSVASATTDPSSSWAMMCRSSRSRSSKQDSAQGSCSLSLSLSRSLSPCLSLQTAVAFSCLCA